jgi:hypothetical protein
MQLACDRTYVVAAAIDSTFTSIIYPSTIVVMYDDLKYPHHMYSLFVMLNLIQSLTCIPSSFSTKMKPARILFQRYWCSLINTRSRNVYLLLGAPKASIKGIYSGIELSVMKLDRRRTREGTSVTATGATSKRLNTGTTRNRTIISLSSRKNRNHSTPGTKLKIALEWKITGGVVKS